MKRYFFTMLAALSVLLCGCSEDSLRFSIPGVEGQMGLKASAEAVTLSQDNGDDTALTFTWGKAQDRGEGTTVSYYFKMDLEGSNFENSIDKIHIAEGQNSVSFTHKEMNAYLNMWGVSPGLSAVVEGEIIAEVTGGDYYMKPEISTTTVSVTGYEIQPRPLYLYGTATQNKGLQMTEVLSETQYRYAGVLYEGTYKITKGDDGTGQTYALGTEKGTLTECEGDVSDSQLLQIAKSGFYVLNINLATMTYTITSPTPEISSLYVVGGACAAGWTIGNALEMTQDAVNKFQFTWTGQLSEGELKFPLERDESWACDFIMAQTASQSIRDSKAVRRNTPDTKWYVNASEAGKYKITIDTYNMTVTFEKQQEVVVPDDVPYRKVYVWGSATSNGWDFSYTLPLEYDATAKKGTFTITTTLKEGELKFPLNSGSWSADQLFIHPKTVGESGYASLSDGSAAAYADGDDLKWYVTASEAGTYKISVNVTDMTVKFEKQ